MSEETCEFCLGVGYLLCGNCDSVDPQGPFRIDAELAALRQEHSLCPDVIAGMVERIAELEETTAQQSVQLANQSAQLAAKDEELRITDLMLAKRDQTIEILRDAYDTGTGLLRDELATVQYQFECEHATLEKQFDEDKYLRTLHAMRIAEVESQLAAKDAELADHQSHVSKCFTCGQWTCGFCGIRDAGGRWNCEICHHGKHVCAATELLAAVKEECKAVRNTADKEHSRLEKALELIRRIEWNPSATFYHCPSCYMPKSKGHQVECELVAVLKGGK